MYESKNPDGIYLDGNNGYIMVNGKKVPVVNRHGDAVLFELNC